jgi:hypothetical protein
MAQKIKCDIRTIIGELSEINSRNEQKVVAMATWNDQDETVNIRKFNTVDDILLGGISLAPHEATRLIYMLLATHEIEYDKSAALDIINSRKSNNAIDITKMMEDLDEDETQAPYSRSDDGGISIHLKED